MLKYTLICYLFALNVQASDKPVNKSDEPNVHQPQHKDPFKDCSFDEQPAPKKGAQAPKTIVAKELVGKIVKVTYSDGSTRIIG